ncbi:putative ABC transporter ATP-binding protein [Candidatus Bilamarchaeum dharawalense]|uniref:Putative ABC transporter ATP-binding protein n=1 Tax=Candidatus Bilamarchaeum dharawalense TaxID=2885759 RepID=A0A5E4LRM3_9ARCH|nr:putative ABC transporter ATP-binding protein [Candidatus Bilamarchaeum dharawalense]
MKNLGKNSPSSESPSNSSKKKEVLRLASVSKIYKMGPSTIRALDGANLVIYEGEMLCIVGPSGSGKSTLLHIMGLLDTPTSGERYIDGIETTKMNERDQARVRGKKIGFVFQKFNLIPSLTALENVELPLVLSNGYNNRKEKAKKVLQLLDMGNRLDHYPSQLSGGQVQRVAIARALVNEPDVILADEPTGNLDSKTGKEVLEILSQLNKQGKTIVIITHDESISKIVERVVRIRDGKIIES